MQNPNQQRIFTLPAFYHEQLQILLKLRGYDLAKPGKLADAVLRLSDFYATHPDQSTPWREVWAQVASLVYFFPLNYSRMRAVAHEVNRLGFFSNLKDAVDFGCGTGSGLFAVSDELSDKSDNASLVLHGLDSSQEALELCSDLDHSKRILGERLAETSLNFEIEPQLSKKTDPASRLLIASYVLTELPKMPQWWLSSEALILVEPSTRDDARRLQALRGELMDAGYSLWAPCPHHDACPLLEGSARDWCHDRIHFQAPSWFTEIEKLLPMKNRTLTFSYLAARKNLAPPKELSGYARIVGDRLEEKGKTRQSVCRGPEREFLAWFPQRLPKVDGKQQDVWLERGDLAWLSSNLEKKSSEVRIKSLSDVQRLPPDFVLKS